MTAEACATIGLTGGCQCGAVRYRLERRRRPAPASAIAACARRPAARRSWPSPGSTPPNLVFTRGAPTTFASSEIAERGFCAACGTPLTYRDRRRATASASRSAASTIPRAFAPTRRSSASNCGCAWFDLARGLARSTESATGSPRSASRTSAAISIPITKPRTHRGPSATGDPTMTDAFIYDHVRTPRGRGKPDGSLHTATTLHLAATALQRDQGPQPSRARATSTTS